MNTAVAQSVKHGLFTIGHYGRALRRARFPGVAVLGYHGLRGGDWPNGSLPFGDLHVHQSAFEAHCRFIRETCDPISLDDWRAAIRGAVPLPPRPVLLTFDDGYRSVFTMARPILRKYALPAAVFACSDPAARRRLLWFDHVAARDGEDAVEKWKTADYRSWRVACADVAPAIADDDPRAVMSPSDLAELAAEPGIEIGAHTARHPILMRAGAEGQREEIVESRDRIASWTGRPVRAFAYPNGRPGLDYSAETTRILADLGFDLAFTMQPAFATAREAPLERSRFLIVADVSAAELAHRLSIGWPR